MNKIALRMDDIGASTKLYNQHGKVWWKILGINIPLVFFANWLFFKRISPFKRWAPYSELRCDDWERIFNILQKKKAKITLGITACWAEDKYKLIPFNKKYPHQAKIIKEGVKSGIVEVANHGLTHCVLDNNCFLPKLFQSNRKYHREFWGWLSEEYHKEHIQRSQDILREIFDCEIVTFIPPGNIWTETTEYYCLREGIRYLSCKKNIILLNKIKQQRCIINNCVEEFHDRDLIVNGMNWLEKKITSLNAEILTVKEYCEHL